MKTFLSICLLLNVKMLYSQNRVFIEAVDLSKYDSAKNIKKIKMPLGKLSRNIIVTYDNDTKSNYVKKSIWGYQTAKEITRLYDGDPFVLVDTTGIIIYKTWGRTPVYYFSERLDRDIKLFSKIRLAKFLGETKFEKLYKQSQLVQRLCKYY